MIDTPHIHNMSLSADLKYPVRIKGVYFAQGQNVASGEKLYTLEDGTGGQIDVTAHEDGKLLSHPIAIGQAFTLPAVIAQYEVIPPAPTGIDADLSAFLAVPVNKSRHATYRQYRAAAMNALIQAGHEIDAARAAVDGPDVQARWDGKAKPQQAKTSSDPKSEPKPTAQPQPKPEQQAKAEPDKTEFRPHTSPPSSKGSRTAAQDSPAPTSFLAACVAVLIGAAASAVYALIVSQVPLLLLGTALPIGVAWVVICLAYRTLRGPLIFRLAIACIGAVIAIIAHWAVYMYLTLGLDPVASFTDPASLFRNVALISSYYSFSLGGSGSSGLSISGAGLQAFWAAEAAFIASAMFAGLFIARNDQTVSASQAAAVGMQDMRKSVLPGVFRLIVSIAYGSILVFLVYGAVYLISEWL